MDRDTRALIRQICSTHPNHRHSLPSRRDYQCGISARLSDDTWFMLSASRVVFLLHCSVDSGTQRLDLFMDATCDTPSAQQRQETKTNTVRVVTDVRQACDLYRNAARDAPGVRRACNWSCSQQETGSREQKGSCHVHVSSPFAREMSALDLRVWEERGELAEEKRS